MIGPNFDSYQQLVTVIVISILSCCNYCLLANALFPDVAKMVLDINVHKNILKGVRELEGVDIAKTVLDINPSENPRCGCPTLAESI